MTIGQKQTLWQNRKVSMKTWIVLMSLEKSNQKKKYFLLQLMTQRF